MTEYQPLQNIQKVASSYVGGICRWWFVPIEDIAAFPPIDPVTQQLSAEPVLKSGKTWYGPVKVPDAQLGWQQVPQVSAAGLWYKQKVEGFLPGNDAASFINLGNLALHKFCVIAKLRTRGMLVVIGNEEAGLDLLPETDSGAGAKDTPGHKVTFTGETISPAMVLPLFLLDDYNFFIIDDNGGLVLADDEDTIIYP